MDGNLSLSTGKTLGNEGYFDDEGYLTLTGRIKETIDWGGEKISPQEIDQALEAHPDVGEAAVFGLPHPTLGEIPVAAVVSVPGKTPTKGMLTRFLARRLTNPKLPRTYFMADRIPRGPNGKNLRRRLSDHNSKEISAR